VLVVGNAGAGKSLFVDKCTEQKVPHSLFGRGTATTTKYIIANEAETGPVTFFDTPGLGSFKACDSKQVQDAFDQFVKASEPAPAVLHCAVYVFNAAQNSQLADDLLSFFLGHNIPLLMLLTQKHHLIESRRESLKERVDGFFSQQPATHRDLWRNHFRYAECNLQEETVVICDDEEVKVPPQGLQEAVHEMSDLLKACISEAHGAQFTAAVQSVIKPKV
jgi:GTP-binding protein EngB required for normal cell division